MSFEMKGAFVFFPGTRREFAVPNTVVQEGQESFLRMITQADVSDVSAGGNFYVGLMGPSISDDLTLATLLGEPTSAGGYARQAVVRNSSGWPTIDMVGTSAHARTTGINFTASGSDFSTSVQRAFLCNASSGTAGVLFSVSALFPSAILITDGETVPLQYDLYLT